MIRSFRVAAGLTALIVLAYGSVVGGDPSVDPRGHRRLRRARRLKPWASRQSALHVLAVAAVLILLVDPLTAVDVGAWLSFGATLGILLVAHRLHVAGSRALGATRWTVREYSGCAMALLAATVAAEMALLPISAPIFHRVSVAGLALNFIAIPAMAVVQFAGLVAVMR